HRIRQRLDHLGIHLDRLFLARRGFVLDQSVDAGPRCRGTASLLGIAFLSLRQIACMILVTVQVRAELAGNVWKVLVKEGQQCAREETLMILESMKMEIPVTAPQAGTVKRVLVREGQAVQEGDPLAEIE